MFRLRFVALREDVNLRKHRQAQGPARLLAHAFVGFPALHRLAHTPADHTCVHPRRRKIPTRSTNPGPTHYQAPRLMNWHRVQIVRSFVDCLDMHLPISPTPVTLLNLRPSSVRNDTFLFIETTATVPETITRVP
jgi:hypothetical protein